MGDPISPISWKAKLILMLLSLSMALCLSEVGLTLLYPQATYGSLQDQTLTLFRSSDYMIWELQPNHNEVFRSAEVAYYRVETNDLGFRDVAFERQKPPDTYRIMMLGDSFTFGIPVNTGYDYPTQVETCLNRRLATGLDYEVINAGYASGFSTDSYYVFASEIMPPYQPDLVTVGFYVDNDFVDLLDTIWTEVNEEGLPTRIASRTRDINDEGQLAYTNTPPRYRLPILRDSQTFQLLMQVLVEYTDWVDGEVPTYVRDKSVWIEMYQPELAPRYEALYQQAVQLLRGLHALAQRDDYRFQVLLIPTGIQVSPQWWDDLVGLPYPDDWRELRPQASLRADLEAANIAYLDLLPTFWGQSRYYYAPRQHWDAEGQHMAAAAICEHLIETELRPDFGIVGLAQADFQGMTFYNSDPASTCDSILTLTAQDFPPQRLSVAETCPFQAEGSSQPDSSYRLTLTPESGDPQTFLLRADSTGLYFYNAAAEARTQVDSEFDELTWQVFFSETQLQDYQAAVAQYPASDHSARVLYPGRVLENQEPISNRFAFHLSETALSPAERQDYYHGLFWAINAESNSAFPDGEPSALTEWRAEKTSAHLIAAGYDYLLIDSDWRSFLSAEERQLLEDPRQYELVQEWAIIRQRFYLYRPLSP